MNKLEKINTILIYKRVIKVIESEPQGTHFICKLLCLCSKDTLEEIEAFNYLIANKPTEIYLKEFYNHKHFYPTDDIRNYSNPPWWNPYIYDGAVVYSDFDKKLTIQKCNDQRVLLLRVLIDKLSK